MDVRVVKLAEKLSRFDDSWHPRIVGELNDSYVKVVKLSGEFVWHAHENEDELFLVVSGCLRMQLRGGEVTLGPGELVIVPRGVEHRPVADEVVEVVLIEPKTTINTGTAGGELIREQLEWI
jgi:mannose-6-phosphate isomerase-like protein (cupin superfamily)